MLERFERVCRERGVPVTIQRRVVFEVLLASDDHPTVDEVYRRVSQHAPGVSQATVYRVLELLEDAGFATRIHHPGSASRFDADTSRHDHILCMKCGRTVDVDKSPLQIPPLSSDRAHGFEVSGCSVVYEGVCPDCRADGPGEA
jgi:Fe2+ or Zn2+ uptake regulation protein